MQLNLDFENPLQEKAPYEIHKTLQKEASKQEPVKIVKDNFHFEPFIDGKVVDYSAFPANRMFSTNDKTVLATERPEWVPPLNYKYVGDNYHIPPVCKIGEKYLMCTGEYNPQYYKLSLDGFAATVDYYIKYGKALNRQEAAKKNSRLFEEANEKFNNKDKPLLPGTSPYRYYKSILDGEHKIKPSPIRLLSINRMTSDQSRFFQENNLNKVETWKAWSEIRANLEQKMMDMSCQADDLESAYTKGAETSYGDKNINNTLFQEFGILVKRQNGDAINQEEIKEIKEAFDKIKPVFGNLKNVCAEYGLKVSHSGIKNMHARKTAIGIFYDIYKAVGVKFGDTSMNHLVLAHELSHFLDSRAGKENSHFFLSDKPGSLENQIAVCFRHEMNKNKKTTIDSKYFNRTCECFARTMEQFTAFAVSPVQYLYYCKNEAYVPDTAFREKVIPLIEKLIEERQTVWHTEETVMDNKPGTFETLEAEAARETADYQPGMNIKGMTDDFFEGMARLGCNQREWYRETIERYRRMEKLPRNTLEILKESKRVERLTTEFELEYRERLKQPGTSLFPIYPADITAEQFKDNFITLMKLPHYNKSPLSTSGMLIGKALPHNREAINEFLKKEGCVDETATLKLLQSWTNGEKTRKLKKERDVPIIGIAS
jgi:hypothetical protein